ncbi:MAG TPA: SgcJ/EcaC family oxidoreductase [Pyrinomonadaceae bacterium]|nr:SgcJ/EcaC family oxidoreductase [Pyrinomonadaceae bacterium]
MIQLNTGSRYSGACGDSSPSIHRTPFIRRAAAAFLLSALLTLALAALTRSQDTKPEASKPAEASKPSEASSASSQGYLAEARRAIDKGNAQWAEAWEKGDASMVAALFMEDGSILARNGKIIKGRQQILERQKAAMQSVDPGVKVTVTTLDLWVDGETAYETGKYHYSYKEKGKPATDEGRYVTVWKRQPDGSWKLSMDMGLPQN